ncbi:F0F1 ATP synthase subunit B [Bacteroidota bacterium]
MGLVTPDYGLLFWTVLAFSIVMLILKKFAWKPILKSLKDREDSISDALNSAEKAKEEMKMLRADNEAIMKEARAERDSLIKEAKELKNEIVEEAKTKASIEAEKIMESAKIQLENEKQAAINELKNQFIVFSVEIAEKILNYELGKDQKQKELINNLIDDINFN